MNIFSIYPAASCAVGAVLCLAIAYLLSCNKAAISYKNIIFKIFIQLALALFLLKTGVGRHILLYLTHATQTLSAAAQSGITFIFGQLGSQTGPWGFVFAFHVLPIIVFFSAFVSALSYVGIIRYLIYVGSLILQPLLGASNSETTCALAKSFLGPTEAQLVVRDYLATMSKSELFAIMVSSLTMISASLFALYIYMGVPADHLIAANCLGIPGSLLFAKIIFPAQHAVQHEAIPDLPQENRAHNLVEAIIQGTLEGLQLALAIGALLLSFLALISLLDMICVNVGSIFTHKPITFQDLVGYFFAPFGFLMGLSGHEALEASELIGIKFFSNEMVAFAKIASKNFSPRGLALVTYALCGFANISCMGIVVGGIGTLAPKRRADLSNLAWHALLAATLSNLFSAYLIGILL